MRRSTIIILCIALAALILGAGCCFAAVCIGGTDFSTQHPYIQKTAEFYVTEIDSVVFGGASDNIRVLPSEDGKIHISYYENDFNYYYFINEDKTLSIQYHSGKWYENIQISFFGTNINEHEVVLQIPKEIIDINIKTMSGDIFFYCGNDFENATVSAMSGDIEIGNFGATVLNARSSSGNINVSGITASQAVLKSTSGNIKTGGLVADTIEATVVSGDINIRDTIATKKLDVHSTSGDITVDSDNKFGALLADSTSGDIEIDIASCESANLCSTSGDIDMRVNDIENYQIFTSTTSGRVNVDASAHGSKEIYAKTTSGDIKIS